MLFSLKCFLSYLFFFLFFLKIVTCQDNCSKVQCSSAGNEPEIVTPFGNKDLQGGGCGYPGFSLTCNILDKTVLKLPQSGEFLVRKIDYVNKEIRLYDQNNCLAQRLQQQNLNVNLSPFKAYAYQIYNFFNCPASITSIPNALAVPCLSNPTNTVLVTVPSSSEVDSNITKVLVNGGCQISAPVTIPIPFSAINKVSSYDFSIDDLYLTWIEPKKSEQNKPESNDPKGEENSFDWKKLLTIGFPILGAIAAIATIADILRKRKRRRQKKQEQKEREQKAREEREREEKPRQPPQHPPQYPPQHPPLYHPQQSLPYQQHPAPYYSQHPPHYHGYA
ncbi:putative RING-H2 finger protein ATL21A [Papaver somniferum]|nr:putative RING-H2 finger protein ATL21A [Papaver somniferum]